MDKAQEPSGNNRHGVYLVVDVGHMEVRIDVVRKRLVSHLFIQMLVSWFDIRLRRDYHTRGMP